MMDPESSGGTGMRSSPLIGKRAPLHYPMAREVWTQGFAVGAVSRAVAVDTPPARMSTRLRPARPSGKSAAPATPI